MQQRSDYRPTCSRIARNLVRAAAGAEVVFCGPAKPARSCKCLATPTGPSARAASRAAWDWAVLGTGVGVLPPPAALTRCDVCTNRCNCRGCRLCLRSSARACCICVPDRARSRPLRHVQTPRSCTKRTITAPMLLLPQAEAMLLGCSTACHGLAGTCLLLTDFSRYSERGVHTT